MPSLPRDRDLVLACAVGERSLKATYFLMYPGDTQVANMQGGIAKWARKGFPVNGGAGAAAAPAAFAGSCCGSAMPAVAGNDAAGTAPLVDSACCAQATGAQGCC